MVVCLFQFTQILQVKHQQSVRDGVSRVFNSACLTAAQLDKLIFSACLIAGGLVVAMAKLSAPEPYVSHWSERYEGKMQQVSQKQQKNAFKSVEDDRFSVF